jgi:hypothetical protein
VRATIDDHESGATTLDGNGIKLETTGGPAWVTIKNSTVHGCTDAAIAWDDDHGGTLILEDTCATCQNGTTRYALIANLAGGVLHVDGGTYTGSDGYATVVVTQPGRGGVTIEDATIAGGYAYVTAPADYGPANVRFDGVTWSGEGYGSTIYYALYATVATDANPLRVVQLFDCDGGADNDHLAYIRGGAVTVDGDTMDTYTGGDAALVCVAASTAACTAHAELAWSVTTYWCGDDVAGDCSW